MIFYKAAIRITLLLATSMTVCSAWCSTLTEPMELSQLVSLFMTETNEDPSWSMGAGETGRQIRWTSIGVEELRRCGAYESCRKGWARVAIDKKELQKLRERLEPVEWYIFMASSKPSKFGPEFVALSPSCGTVECTFELKQTLLSNGFTLQQLCHAGMAQEQTTGFLAKRQGKHIYIAYDMSGGSGGTSNSLRLYLRKPASDDSLCADATK